MTRLGAVYLASTAVVVGRVELGPGCNIWYHAVLRGDVGPIRLGARVNVQDGAVLHCDTDVPLEIGDDVVIGHRALVHGRSVGSGTLIGMGAAVLGRCRIGENCLIAAGCVVPPGTEIPPGSVVMGVPGRVIRPIRSQEQEWIRANVREYLALAEQHAAGRFENYSPPASAQEPP